MPKIYATEPVMHDGQTFLPGQMIDADINDVASIMGSGRGTQNEEVARAAKKQYDANVKAADAGKAAQ